jgi:hypothetical protein
MSCNAQSAEDYQSISEVLETLYEDSSLEDITSWLGRVLDFYCAETGDDKRDECYGDVQLLMEEDPVACVHNYIGGVLGMTSLDEYDGLSASKLPDWFVSRWGNPLIPGGLEADAEEITSSVSALISGGLEANAEASEWGFQSVALACLTLLAFYTIVVLGCILGSYSWFSRVYIHCNRLRMTVDEHVRHPIVWVVACLLACGWNWLTWLILSIAESQLPPDSEAGILWWLTPTLLQQYRTVQDFLSVFVVCMVWPHTELFYFIDDQLRSAEERRRASSVCSFLAVLVFFLLFLIPFQLLMWVYDGRINGYEMSWYVYRAVCVMIAFASADGPWLLGPRLLELRITNAQRGKQKAWNALVYLLMLASLGVGACVWCHVLLQVFSGITDDTVLPGLTQAWICAVMLAYILLGIYTTFFPDLMWYMAFWWSAAFRGQPTVLPHPLKLMLYNAVLVVICTENLVWLLCDAWGLIGRRTSVTDSESFFLTGFNIVYLLFAATVTVLSLRRIFTQYRQRSKDVLEREREQAAGASRAAASRAEEAERKKMEVVARAELKKRNAIESKRKRKEKAERKKKNLIEAARQRQEAEARRAEKARKHAARLEAEILAEEARAVAKRERQQTTAAAAAAAAAKREEEEEQKTRLAAEKKKCAEEQHELKERARSAAVERARQAEQEEKDAKARVHKQVHIPDTGAERKKTPAQWIDWAKPPVRPPLSSPMKNPQPTEVPPAYEPPEHHQPPTPARGAQMKAARYWDNSEVLAWARASKVDGAIIEMLAMQDANGDDLTTVFNSVEDVEELLLADSHKKVSRVKMATFVRKIEAIRAI